MPLTLRPLPPSVEVTTLVDEEIRRLQGEDPLRSVTVATPTLRCVVHLRHELARRRPGGALAGVAFATLDRLAESEGGPALRAEGRRRLTRTDLVATLRTELGAEPSLLGSATMHAESERELAERYEELRGAGSDAFDRLSAVGGSAAALARLFQRVRRSLASRYDDLDRAARAADSLCRRTEPPAPLVVVLPSRLRLADATLLAAQANAGELILLDACSSAIASAAGSPRLDPAALMGLLEGPPPPVCFDRVLMARDAPAEVREVVRLVLARLEQGTPAERIALLHSRAYPYAGLLHEALERAGIPSAGPAPAPLASAPSARFLSQLLHLSRRSIGRAALFELLAAAPVRDGAGHAVALGPWDRSSRLAGIIDSDARGWAVKLAALRPSNAAAPDSDGGAAASAPDTAEVGPTPSSPVAGEPSRRPSRRALAADAGAALARFVRDLDEHLAHAETMRTWGELAEWSRAALVNFLGPTEVRAGWPGAAGRADALVLSVLDELGRLDDLKAAGGRERFSHALDLALARPGPHLGQLGRGVVLGGLEEAQGLDLDLVVVLGSSDAELPGSTAPSPLLGAALRRRLGLEVPSAAASAQLGLRRLEGATRGARERIASYAVFGRGGTERTRSRLITAEAPEEALPDQLGAIQSFGGDDRAALDLPELEAVLVRNGGNRAGREATLGREPDLAAGVRLASARAGEPFGAYGGDVGAEGLAARLGSTPFSPTSLEEYASCPFRYYVSHLLGCEVVEDPERRLFIDPRDRGSIVHEVLERYVREQIDREVQRDTEAGAARLEVLANEVFARYERTGRTGKSALWQIERGRLLRALQAEREADERRRAEGVVPLAVEATFGLEGEEPIEVPVGGRTLLFRGMIDRIDRVGGDAVQVVDYKTGRSDRFRAIRDDPVDRGRHLQLPVYGLAARAAYPGVAEVRASFRFIGEEAEEIGVEFGAEVDERFGEVLDVLVSSIDAGLFPYRPGEDDYFGFENCRYCDFDAICPSDRDERWERVSLLPRLARYVALSEGEDAPAPAPAPAAEVAKAAESEGEGSGAAPGEGPAANDEILPEERAPGLSAPVAPAEDALLSMESGEAVAQQLWGEGEWP